MGTFITHLARQRQAFPCAVDTVKPACDAEDMGGHIIDGEFQSDKYPTCPRGKVPLSVKDPTAQDLLWEYVQRRRAIDVEFSDDLELALRAAGYLVRSVAELASRVLARTGTNFELMKWSGEIDWRMRQATGIGKAAAVVDHVRLLVEAGERVPLGGWHHEVYSLWSSAFDRHGVTWAKYTGEESDSDKAESVRHFMAGEANVLMMSLRSGPGLDGLQAVCHTVVIGELDWSPKVHEQLIGRPYRDGQTEPVTVYYCVADEGSDPVIADVLGIKDAQSTGIVDPDSAVEPVLAGSQTDTIRKLAADVLARTGIHAPVEPLVLTA